MMQDGVIVTLLLVRYIRLTPFFPGQPG